MRQVKLLFSDVQVLLREILGVVLNNAQGIATARLTPGLINFITNLRTRVHVERFVEKLEEESKFLQKKQNELAEKFLGEDKANWASKIMMPVDADIPKKIMIPADADIPELIEEMGTGNQIANPEYKTTEIANPEYKEKLVDNENWEEYKKQEEILLGTEISVQCFPFTDNLLDIEVSYCLGEKKGNDGSFVPYFRISGNPESGESLEQFSAPIFTKKVISIAVSAENLKGHKYPELAE